MRSYSNINMLDQEMLDMLNDCADGNPELIHDIFDSFTPEADELIEAVRNSIKKQNFENLKKSAHALAGISGSIGATRLHQIATDVENAIKSNHNDVASVIAEELFPNYELLKDEIHKYQESMGD
ncbi:MAG: Hpt domain-containing protein [Bacteroidales bacterium]|nr:Hpt domain-containing protein [Bacteroidales bacterium]